MKSTAQDDITGYVDAVRAALADLPESTRDELLEDLPEHLAEVKADGAGSLVDRLGTPEAYAAELRATAGFVGGFPEPPNRNEQLIELRDAVLARLRVADARVGPLLGYPRASEFLMLLRPAWWVLRGYLAAMVVAWALDDSDQSMGLLPRIGGSEVVALLLLAGGILGSLWLGRRTAAGLRQWPRYALYAGSVVLVLVAIGGFANADSSAQNSDYTQVNYQNQYSQVQDVFVYDGQGRLVKDARLFDQNGQPIQIGTPHCYDVRTGEDFGPVDESVYPYCPDQAPFQVPGTSDGSAAPSATATASATASATATATASASATASATAVPSPTPSVVARSLVPTPSPTRPR